VALDTEEYDDNTDIDTTTHLYTVPVTAVYLLLGQVSSSTATNRIGCRFNRNSGAETFAQNLQAQTTSGQCLAHQEKTLTAGDTIGLEIFEDAATGSLTVNGVFSIRLVST
jgi:hypothetical protein